MEEIKLQAPTELTASNPDILTHAGTEQRKFGKLNWEE
jgi:hypothetical protein